MDDNEMGDATLDRLLDRVERPLPSAALERRILADFDRISARWSVARFVHGLADAVWPGAPAWQPAGVLAVALLIGLGIATFAPFDIAQQDDASANVFALDASPDVDAGQGI